MTHHSDCYRKQLVDKEQQLQKNSTELTNQMLQHSQIADRMRHYEANGQLHEMLQQELEQAKVWILFSLS